MSSSPFKIFYIEGNIGTGKSTLIQHLKLNEKTQQSENKDYIVKDTENKKGIIYYFKKFVNLIIKLYFNGETMTSSSLPIIFIEEPLSHWEAIKDNEGKNILQNFYENQTKYAFSFQVMSLQTRSLQLRRIIEDNPKGAIIISERSIFTDRDIFAKMLYDDGKINSIEMKVYNLVFDQTQQILDGIIQKRIYLRSSPQQTFIRKCGRNRPGEEGVCLEYLQKCHNYHEYQFSNNSEIIYIDDYIIGKQDYSTLINKINKMILEDTEKI